MSEEAKKRLREFEDKNGIWRPEDEPEVEAAPDEPEAAAAPESAPTPFELWYRMLDEDTKSLGPEKLAGIYAASVKVTEEERRKALEKRAQERALHHARATAGLLPKEAIDKAQWLDRMNEKVTFTPELGSFRDGTPADEGLRIDGRLLRSGFPIEITRAQLASYMDICFRNQIQHLEHAGLSRVASLRQRAGYLNGVA